MDPTERFAGLVRDADGAPLDLAAALIGVSFDPRGSVESVVAALDRLAAECEPTFESLLELFHHQLTGNTADYGDPRNSYLHEVLHRGVGIPITLSVCAMEVGRRLGVPVLGVGLPGHFVVRCDERFADPFHGGVIVEADRIEAHWRRVTGTHHPLDPRLLQPVGNRSILLRMLNNLKQTFVAMDDPVPLRVLARLRSAFPELAHERAEYSRWLRHWN